MQILAEHPSAEKPVENSVPTLIEEPIIENPVPQAESVVQIEEEKVHEPVPVEITSAIVQAEIIQEEEAEQVNI